MTLDLTITGARLATTAVTPALRFGCHVEGPADRRVHAAILNCQIRIEPDGRRYTPGEEDRLEDLFGTTDRWGDTLQAFPWANVTFSVPRFEGATDVEIEVPCSYDLEVAAGKYLHALRDGEIPLLFLFSGSVMLREGAGVMFHQLPWDREDRFRLPVDTWRSLVDLHWPDSGWLRLSRDTIDRLQTHKSRNAIPTWDATVEHLLDRADHDAASGVEA